jgi:hypothetical protein
VNGRELYEARRRRSYLSDLFPKQRAFFDDPAKVKAANPGRRSGKTWVCVAGLYDVAKRHPRSLNPYICLSAVSARNIVWPIIQEFNERYRLGLKLHAHELIAELDNGSKIFCVGGDDARKVEALRGGKYGRAVVDEAGSFPRTLLRYLCEDVLEAAMLDLDGDIWLVGTPNAACVGHFHDVTTGSNPQVAKVATHHWTVLDNVHIPHASTWLDSIRERHGWGVDHPVFRREYLGHWVRDASSLVFRFDRARHLVPTVPPELRGVVGVDLGSSDKRPTTAFAVCTWSQYDKTVYVVYADKRARLNAMDTAEEIQRIQGRHPTAVQVVVDEGGLGKSIADLWRERTTIKNIKAAEKKQKMAFVELINGEFDGGRIKLLDGPTRQLVEEMELLQFNEERDGYDDRFADHCADAFTYSYRECFAWTQAAAPDAGPAFGSPAYELARAAELKQKAIDQSLQRARREGKMLQRRFSR